MSVSDKDYGIGTAVHLHVAGRMDPLPGLIAEVHGDEQDHVCIVAYCFDIHEWHEFLSVPREGPSVDCPYWDLPTG